MSRDGTLCAKHVYGGGRGFMGGLCSKPGKVKIGERWYCSTHSPEGEAKRRERQKLRDAEQDAKWRAKIRESRYAADAVKRCKELGIVDPLTEIAKVRP